LHIKEFDSAQKSLYIGFMNANVAENTNTDEIFQKHSMYIDAMCNHATKKDLGNIKVEKN